MPRVRFCASVLLLAVSATLGCSSLDVGCSVVTPSTDAREGAAASPPPAAEPASGPGATPSMATLSGTVAEVTSAGGYTWVRLTGNGADRWIAAPEVLAIAAGDRLEAVVSAEMRQYHSRVLNRDFDAISFVSRITRDGVVLEPVAPPPGTPAGSVAHGMDSASATTPNAPFEPVSPARGGLRVADIWARRTTLNGQPVTVRGRVVKANYEIMGVNWYHLQDGSGTEQGGDHDLTITSAAQVRVGDVVTASGTLVTDKDFGAGYAYDAIVEKATIVTEAETRT
jgi:hypothetical protein